MVKKSAGLLIYYYFNNILKVLLVHPGGPFYAKKDAGAWSVPKGEYGNDEDALASAKREFEEETGNKINTETFIALSPVKLKSGKLVQAWAANIYFENPFIKSNVFELEWPPRSGRQQQFFETDKAEWFTVEEAKEKINAGQIPLLDELIRKLAE